MHEKKRIHLSVALLMNLLMIIRSQNDKHTFAKNQNGYKN